MMQQQQSCTISLIRVANCSKINDSMLPKHVHIRRRRELVCLYLSFFANTSDDFLWDSRRALVVLPPSSYLNLKLLCLRPPPRSPALQECLRENYPCQFEWKTIDWSEFWFERIFRLHIRCAAREHSRFSWPNIFLQMLQEERFKA